MQTHTTNRRRKRVYKSLHKPLTYLGVERTLFYFVCVGGRWRVHANSSITMNLYAQAVTGIKRSAQSKVARLACISHTPRVKG